MARRCLTPLPNSSDYAAFEVLGTVPAGAVSFSAWVWTGANGDLSIDDLVLVRNTAAPATAPAETTGSPKSVIENLQEAALAGDLTKLSLKSGRSLDLSAGGALEKDPYLALALGAEAPVYANGWSLVPAFDSAVIARGIVRGERKTIATTVNGPGLVSAQWLLDTLPARATLILLVDGLERERWDGRSGTGAWRTVAAKVYGPGLYTIEFRLESVRNAIADDPYLTAGVRDFTFHRGYPVLRPDLTLSDGRKSPIGENVYSPDGSSQNVKITLRGKKPTLVDWSWNNDAPDLEDGVNLSGPSGNRSHRLTYYTVGTGRRNITAEVAAGLYQTELAAPGEIESFEVELRRTGRAKKFTGILRGKSLLDTSKIDAVRLQSKPR